MIDRRRPASQIGLPPAQGLYLPEYEHDACGVGFICHIKGKASNQIVKSLAAARSRLCDQLLVGVHSAIVPSAGGPAVTCLDLGGLGFIPGEYPACCAGPRDKRLKPERGATGLR